LRRRRYVDRRGAQRCAAGAAARFGLGHEPFNPKNSLALGGANVAHHHEGAGNPYTPLFTEPK
jgi:hypothetical protein